MKSTWSKEELVVKAMANDAGLVLVKVTTGNAKRQYTRYKLRGEGGYIHDWEYDLERDESVGDFPVKLFTLDEARECIADELRILEWEPTDAELNEIIDFFEANGNPVWETREEQFEHLKELVMVDKKVLVMMQRLVRGKAAMNRSRTCQ